MCMVFFKIFIHNVVYIDNGQLARNTEYAFNVRIDKHNLVEFDLKFKVSTEDFQWCFKCTLILRQQDHMNSF